MTNAKRHQIIESKRLPFNFNHQYVNGTYLSPSNYPGN